MWVSLFPLLGISASDLCQHTPEIVIPLNSPRMTCADPLSASKSYLSGGGYNSGPCVTYHANQRFDRFREWLTSIGGYVSPKISFQRGYFVNQYGKLMYGNGGIFLNDNEFLHRGETLFVVPDIATFNDRMILRAYPRFQKFSFGDTTRFWQSIGLAALLRHRPDLVGPWQALLPDMNELPLMWPAWKLKTLEGTQTGAIIKMGQAHINEGCHRFESTLLKYLAIECRDIHEAHAIIASRAFGLERSQNSHDSGSAIPFGPDLLNHSPHTVSWISQVVSTDENDRPAAIETVYFLLGFTMGDSRELFNNYGGHGFHHNYAMYGYTAPDSHDELVISASLHALFDGVRYEATQANIAHCAKRISVADIGALIPGKTRKCPVGYEARINQFFDDGGAFRLTNRDVVGFSPQTQFKCKLPIGSLLWKYAMKQLNERHIRLNMHHMVLNLNVIDGIEPWLPYDQSVLMALCSVPADASTRQIDQLVSNASTCAPIRDQRNLEEYPKSHLVRELSRVGLYDLCSWYEVDMLGSLELNLASWIAYRNARIMRKSRFTVRVVDSLELESPVVFRMFIQSIVDGKQAVISDNNGPIDTESDRVVTHLSLQRIIELEEVYRYKMQTAFLVQRKCRKPLERVVRDFTRRTLI